MDLYKNNISVLLLTCVILCAAGLSVFALDSSDLLFYAPFDGSTKAAVAGGNSEQTLGTAEYVEGIRGQGALVGGETAPLKYQTSGNFNKDQGTMSLWIKPVDWKREDGKGHTFLVFPGEGPVVQCYLLYNYAVGYTWFLIMRPGGNNRFIGNFEPKWEPGKWHHLVATWKKGEVCTYLDGELQARETEDIPVMEKAAPEFQVGENQNKTVFDELMIFNRPLMPSEVKALYQKDAPVENKSTAHITIGKAKTAPGIDAINTQDEWDNAAGAGNLLDTFFGKSIQEQCSNILMSYDDRNLYLALRFPIPEEVRRSPDLYPRGPLKSDIRERDGDIWLDDSFEILLLPQEGNTQHTYRWVINSIGSVFDSKDGQKEWTSSATIKSVADKNNWILEAAIPFSGLGVSTPANGSTWHFNLVQNWKTLANQTGKLATGMADLVFSTQTPIVQINSIGQPDQGQMVLDGTVSNPGSSEASVTLTAQTPGKEINETTTLKLEPGASKSFKLQSAVAEQTASTLIVECRDSTGKSLYLRQFPFVFRPIFMPSLHLLPSKNRMVVDIDRTGAGTRPTDKSFFTDVTIRIPGSKKALKHLQSEQFTQTRQQVSVDLTDLVPGSYEVVASLSTPDRKLGEKILKFEKKTPPAWLNNKAGISAKVPSPFTPLKVLKTGSKLVKISCWGRTYEFNGSLFPSQIITQGKSLLSSPIRLVLSLNGNKTILQSGDTTVTKSSDTRVILVSKCMLDYAQINMKTTIEYDGFIWFDISINNKATLPVESLAFDIPFTSEYATLVYNGPNTGGALKVGEYNSQFTNFFWVGCEDGGIEWVTESQQGWKITKPQQTIQVLNGSKPGTEAITRFNIIDTLVSINKPIKLGFGIQATPVRPKPKGWRQWRLTSYEHPKQEQPNIDAKPWILMWNPRWSQYLNYPVVNPEWKPLLKRRESEGTRSCLYAQIMRTSPIPPEYRYFYEEWRMTPSTQVDFDTIFETIKKDKNPDWTQIGSAPVCVKSSFTDFYMSHLKQSVKQADIKGYYFDLTGPEPCSNQEHGCGWVDDNGEVQAIWPIRAVREFMKRTYVILKENDPTSIIGMHMSGRNLPPMDAFCDVMIDGELFNQDIQRQIAAKGKDNGYCDFLTLDKMRAEYMSSTWGPLTAFLPAFVPGAGEKYHQDSPEAIANIEHLVGLFTLHDSQMWPAWMNPKPLYDTWAAQQKFGWDDKVKFIPYWDKKIAEYITIDSNGVQAVVCSIFKRADKVMLVLFNNSDTDTEVTIHLRPDKLGLTTREFPGIKDYYSSGYFYNLKDEKAAWKLPLRKRNFRMLVPGK